MGGNVLGPLLSALGLLWLLAGPVTAAETCTKLVFNRFCLGGDINQLARSQPGYVAEQREGERLALIYGEGSDLVYVLGYQGRIYKIVRKYDNPTLLKYDDLLQSIGGKYGQPEDLSRFPNYVRSQASRIGAIRRGDGKAVHLWRPPGERWSLALSWTREMGLSLTCSDEELMKLQQRSLLDGL